MLKKISEQVIQNPTVRGVSLLLLTQAYAMALVLVCSMILTRTLGPEQYGVYSLVIAVTGFGVLFSGVGFFSSIGVLLAEEKKQDKQRELIGAIFVVSLVLGFIYGLAIYILSFFVDQWFNQNIGHILRLLWPILVFLPGRMLILQIAKGQGDVNLIAKLRGFIPTLFILGIGFFYFFSDMSVLTLSLAQFLSIFLVINYLAWRLRPCFANLPENMASIFRKNREYGLRLYGSQITANASQQISGILIPLFVMVTELGYYRLAMMITAPIVLISQNIALKFFRSFAGKNGIDSRIIRINILILLVQALFLFLFMEWIIVIMFGPEYRPAASIGLVLVLGNVFNALYQIPDAFMNANSLGRCVLWSSFIMMMTSVTANFVLIPQFGSMGAAYAYLLSNLSYFISITFFYMLTRRKQALSISEIVGERGRNE